MDQMELPRVRRLSQEDLMSGEVLEGGSLKMRDFKRCSCRMISVSGSRNNRNYSLVFIFFPPFIFNQMNI